MTYLELVNNILLRLREREVTSVNDNAYSKLIGVFINEAKTEIENVWNWSALRETLTLTTESGVFAYELNGTQNNFSVMDVVNQNGDFFMEYRTQHDFNQFYLNQNPETGNPRYYNFNGVSADRDTMVDLYPKPDAVYTIFFNIIQRTTNMTENSDTLKIPDQPVLNLAYAKAIEERGEDGGISASSAYATAQRILNDAVAQDAARHSEEVVWYS
tara:strand:+ start:863 stop:1507 length:645 start_codon:yes stop_codon:yes gene_type:complete